MAKAESNWDNTVVTVLSHYSSRELMAKFLNTSATNYYLEELIKASNERLTLISPFLQLNDRVKELLEDKNRLKIDIRVIYGKNELQPEEITWLRELDYVRTSFCKNLHAKCYLSEKACIITSMNLYEFSQINNNEMGILMLKDEDTQLYKDAYEEAQRIIRISDEIRMTLEKVQSSFDEEDTQSGESPDDAPTAYAKLTTYRLAQKLGVKNSDLENQLIEQGYLEYKGSRLFITQKGRDSGGEFRTSKKGPYFLWPADLRL